MLWLVILETEPVAWTYMCVPKHLYDERKDYLMDLSAQGWIEKKNKKITLILSFTHCMRKKE